MIITIFILAYIFKCNSSSQRVPAVDNEGCCFEGDLVSEKYQKNRLGMTVSWNSITAPSNATPKIVTDIRKSGAKNYLIIY